MSIEPTQLKPCPFCGGEAMLAGTFDPPVNTVRCKECGAAAGFEQGDGSILVWNTRHSAPAGEVEPVAYADTMPGSGGGFTMAVFKALDVPVGAGLYTHPAPDLFAESAKNAPHPAPPADLVELARAIDLARHTDDKAHWLRVTKLTDAALKHGGA